MYQPIQMTFKNPNQMDQFTLFKENYTEDKFYTEAVFANGRQELKPIVNQFQAVIDELHKEVKESGKDNKAFDPVKFWRHKVFKDLEDKLRNLFGFRNVEVMPFLERYIPQDKQFESRQMNAEIEALDRFPIDGLVSDKGFYDSTHSANMKIYITLGLLYDLTAEECTAVLLHEFGHSIDPALVDINYVEVNVLSKYLTDRRHKINNRERAFIEKDPGLKKNAVFTKLMFRLNIMTKSIFGSILDAIFGINKKKEDERQRKEIDEAMKRIRKTIEEDKYPFRRQTFSEAFADNFARMYGFGPELMRGLQKMDKHNQQIIRSRFHKEKDRQRAIIMIAEDSLRSTHRTDIHRIRNLLAEYKNDLKDPNNSDKVKQQLREDMEELELILNEYLNNRDAMQRRVNRIINEELIKMEKR